MTPRETDALLKSDSSDTEATNWVRHADGTVSTRVLSECRPLLHPHGSIVGSDVAAVVRPLFATVASALPGRFQGNESDTTDEDAVALVSLHPQLAPLTHGRLADFVCDLGVHLHRLALGRGSRLALVIPNGDALALALVAVAQWATAIPLSFASPVDEVRADVQRAHAHAILGPSLTSSDVAAARRMQGVAHELGLVYIGITSSATEAGCFTLDAMPDVSGAAAVSTSVATSVDTTPNGPDDYVLILFTSGTTGHKKLVPHTWGHIVTAAATIALSWDLTPRDVNLNLMPLFHVGGIVRQVFSPIVSGGSVICCPSFDPATFWTLLTHRNQHGHKPFTWYYAAPTMHQLILQWGRDEGHIDATTGACRYPLRMIANAAGGLLPSLAHEMKATFGAHVLPSYGMTECMPISSPPSKYNLEKPGTSGVPVGPHVAILNTSTEQEVPRGQEGPICVRGAPCFGGYGQIVNGVTMTTIQANPHAKDDTFTAGGWFNTGDLGYMDDDGFLYITGRSKEVINRGGEIISPMEVEEAVTSHPDVQMCAAFSALHNVLQEVVGIVITMQPNRPRLDLPSLHEYLGERLAGPKWPQCIVFMEGGLPKSHTNKLLRVKLNTRLQLPELTDDMSILERTFEATCPPQGTGLEVPIPAHRVTGDTTDVAHQLTRLVVPTADQSLVVQPHPTRMGATVCYLVNLDRKATIETAMAGLHRYLVPTHFVEQSAADAAAGLWASPKMTDAVASILQGDVSSSDPIVATVQELFLEMLDLDYVPSPESSFFHLGGSSMLASQLASKIRKRFGIPWGGSEVFQHASANAMGKLIRLRSEGTNGNDSGSNGHNGTSSRPNVTHDGVPFDAKRLAPEPTFMGALFQLVPMFFLFPVWQVTRYLLFFCLLLWSIDNVPGDRDIGRFIFAYLVFHTIWITITPLVFVAIKWIVIGRYKAGRYPIWGSYYLRWWFVDICRKLFLRGIWGGNEVTLNFYYRMLGAKIGKNARISLECDLAEFDLVEVGEGAAIEFATLRSFGVDNGAMILGPVRVGNFASLGTKSVVPPYTSIPDHCHLGPVTSSYEVGPALDVKHARVNRRCLPEPNMFVQLFVVGPISFLVSTFSQIPPFVVLYLMLEYKGEHDNAFTTLNDLMRWLCDPHRIPYYIGIRVARALLSPFFYMAAAISVKKCLIGTFRVGVRDTQNQWQLARHALAATLFSRARIQEVADLVGRHYEIVSMLYRCLGAKVGSRVFWPGHQPVTSGEFDLLEIGDDVVFGSRSSIFMTTVDSCKKVILCAGSNVADNCVVLPGSIIGKNAVLGSNSLCPEDRYLPDRSIWLGSTGGEPSCLERGAGTDSDAPQWGFDVQRDSLQMTGDDSTLRPFGRAFYLKKAPYFVWPLEWIVLACVVVKSLIVTLHALPLLGALHGAAAILYGVSFDERDYNETYHPLYIYSVVLCMFHWTNLMRVLAWLAIELTAKWSLIGQRAEGRYNYDETSYAQRWELYQIIAKTRKFSRLNFLDFFSGTPYMSAYFRWNGGSIGKDCCMYPAGADPFMSEPDLVFLGDRCVVDCASIVSHLNTRGNFELVKIVLENDCTLRTRSRVQQGVYMEQGSQVLEKSLALTGEVIEANSVWQGSPASWWFQYDREQDEAAHDETSRLLTGKPSYYSV